MVPAPSHRVPRVPWYSGSRAFCRLPSLTGLSPSLAGLPRAVLLAVASGLAVLTPGCVHPGLGSSGSARRYSRNHFCFLFLRLLRCFSSPGFSHSIITIVDDTVLTLCRVSPFGYLRIFASLQLPAAFRRSVRPSSAPSVKASTVRPYLLNHFLCVFAYLMNSSLFNSSFVKSFTLFGKTLFCLSVIRFSKIL